MWAEFIFSRDDLARLVAQALPLTIHLGDADAEADHSLGLSDLGEVTLVADVGLRVTCKAHIHWPVLGLDVPLALNALTLLLMPTIGEGADGDRLVFRASIEHADFEGFPALIDRGIAAAINAKLAAKGGELAWNFSRALTYLAPFPPLLEQLEAFAIRPAWGKVRITEEAIVYAASFHSALVRHGEFPPPVEIAPPAEQALPAAPLVSRFPSAEGSLLASRIVTAGALAVFAGVAFFALRGALRSQR
jgi:hypothetical protein